MKAKMTNRLYRILLEGYQNSSLRKLLTGLVGYDINIIAYGRVPRRNGCRFNFEKHKR